jgi:phosphohistidine phosphatase
MTIYFLRHAEAEPEETTDFDRRLTAKGLDQAGKAGKFCARYGLIPDVIVTSPVVRAKQTARAVSEKLGGIKLVEERWLACGMTPDTCRTELKAYARLDSVMLVGHEPDFSDAIARLIGMDDPAQIKIRKASLTALELAGGASRGQLSFSVPVRLM